MTQIEIKSSFHKLIDEIEDLQELKKLYEYFILLKQNIQNSDTVLWDELSDLQKNNLDRSIAQINDPAKHITHTQVVKESLKWLKK